MKAPTPFRKNPQAVTHHDPARHARSRTRTGIAVVVLVAMLFALSLSSRAKQPRDDLFGITFPTPEQGWVSGRWGSMFHTTDGGQTWHRQETGTTYTLSALYFTNPETGWAVGDQGTIIHTTDGGQTWKKQESPVDHFLFDVHFADASTGWIASERTTILATDDGGETWEIQFQDQDYILKALAFCDSRNGWAVGEYGFIYHTANGGKTWEHQAGEFGWSMETGQIVAGTYLFDVTAVNPQTAWVVGMGGYTAKTTDGGQTWVKQDMPLPQTHLFGVSADRSGRMIVCGNGLLCAGSDGGRTFTCRENDPTIMYGWLNGTTIDPSGRMIAVGKEGWVYMTPDSGASWDRVSTQ